MDNENLKLDALKMAVQWMTAGVANGQHNGAGRHEILSLAKAFYAFLTSEGENDAKAIAA